MTNLTGDDIIGFQSTHPVRDATGFSARKRQPATISIHAPREGCDDTLTNAINAINISIHAPREGCDSLTAMSLSESTVISIHAPREGCDKPWPLAIRSRKISIHAPREGCDHLTDTIAQTRIVISIHAPREGCDWADEMAQRDMVIFQSTHPVRDATTCRK